VLLLSETIRAEEDNKSDLLEQRARPGAVMRVTAPCWVLLSDWSSGHACLRVGSAGESASMRTLVPVLPPPDAMDGVFGPSAEAHGSPGDLGIDERHGRRGFVVYRRHVGIRGLASLILSVFVLSV
jgi:hypothetical protein